MLIAQFQKIGQLLHADFVCDIDHKPHYRRQRPSVKMVT